MYNKGQVWVGLEKIVIMHYTFQVLKNYVHYLPMYLMGACINWHTQLTSKLISGLVNELYCRTPTTILKFVGCLVRNHHAMRVVVQPLFVYKWVVSDNYACDNKSKI